MTEVIQLISGPRNISTALMYSFANRKDTAVVDEPFYAYYLSNFDVDHPGADETISSMSSKPEEVISDVIFKKKKEDYFFVKNMAHHIDSFDYSYSNKIRNLFLIRDPKRLIASFSKVIENPKGSDVGLKREAELFAEISEKGEYSPVVVDSGELLKNPKKVITEMCSQLEIPYDDSMLSWKAGARSEDGVWAKYWYYNVHKSTGFVKQKRTEVVLEERLLPIYEEVLPYYQSLYNKAIKA